MWLLNLINNVSLVNFRITLVTLLLFINFCHCMKDWTFQVGSFNDKLISMSGDIQTQRQFMSEFDNLYRGLVSDSEAKQWHKAENAKLRKLLDSLKEFLLNGGIYVAKDLTTSARKPALINILPTGKIELYDLRIVELPVQDTKKRDQKPKGRVYDEGQAMTTEIISSRTSSFEILNGDGKRLLDNAIAQSLEPESGSLSAAASILGKSLSQSLEKIGLKKEPNTTTAVSTSDEEAENVVTRENLFTTSEAQKVFSIPLDLKKIFTLSPKQYHKYSSFFSSNVKFKDFKSNNLVRLEFRDGSNLMLQVKTHSEHFVDSVAGLSRRCQARKSELIVKYCRIYTEWAKMDFDKTKDSHVSLLFDLWQRMNLKGKPELVSEEWLVIGFQNKNPVSDFRSMGMYSLKNLNYYAKHCLESIKKQFTLGTMNYPWAAAAIQVSKFIMDSLKISDDSVLSISSSMAKNNIGHWESPLLSFLASPGHVYSPKWTELSEALFSDLEKIERKRQSLQINGILNDDNEAKNYTDVNDDVSSSLSGESIAARTTKVIDEFFCFCMDLLFILYYRKKANYMQFQEIFKEMDILINQKWLTEAMTFYDLFENSRILLLK